MTHLKNCIFVSLMFFTKTFFLNWAIPMETIWYDQNRFEVLTKYELEPICNHVNSLVLFISHIYQMIENVQIFLTRQEQYATNAIENVGLLSFTDLHDHFAETEFNYRQQLVQRKMR